jgi:rhomboid protease GluP
VQILRQRNDWSGLADFLARRAVRATPELVNAAIRAFGEIGRLDAMIQAHASHAGMVVGNALQLASLMVLAFSGRVDATRLQLTAIDAMPAPVGAFWQATALQAAGRRDEARRLLDGIDPTSLDEMQRDMIAARLQAPVAEALWLLSPPARAYVDTLQTQSGRDLPLGQVTWRQTPVTYGLILANCAMFAVETFRGGSQDMQTLFDLGALWPASVLEGHEWWRLVTAMFLHAGPEHLVSNMFALWVLGRFVEAAMGPVRTAIIYGAGGLASMAGVLWLTWMGLIEPNLLVGASGAIFALLGAIALRRLADFLTSRTLADRRNLSLILMVLAIQAVIDLAVPQISFTAHGIGLAAGMLLGWLLAPKRTS